MTMDRKPPQHDQASAMPPPVEIAMIRPLKCEACGSIILRGKFKNNGNPVLFTATFTTRENGNFKDKKWGESTSVKNNSITKWSVQNVSDFIKKVPGCAKYVDAFINHQIDGKVLLLLKREDLVSYMGIKLGPALKILAIINALRLDENEDL